MPEGWISIRNWRRFQHYDPAKRVPPWIKAYTELMDDAAYLELTEHCALVLHRLWLTYASARCQLPLTTSTLSRQLGLRVMRRDLERLCDAGFIAIVASKMLAEGYHDASASRAREETETEEEKDIVPGKQATSDVDQASLPADSEGEEDPEPEPSRNGTGPMAEDLREELEAVRERARR